MSESHTPRAAGRFVALLASLTMIVAGLVGVALAAPASAEQPSNPGGNMECSQIGEGWTQVAFTDPQPVVGSKTAAWTTAEPVDAIIVKGSDAAYVQSVSPAASSGVADSSGLINNGGQQPDISNLKACKKPATTTYTAPGGSQTYCVAGADVTVTWAGGSSSVSQAAADQQAADNKTAAYEAAGIAQDATPSTCTFSAPGGSGSYCVNDTLTTVTWAGASGYATQELANAAAAANKTAAYEAAGIAQDAPQSTSCGGGGTDPFRATASVNGSEQLCFNDQNVTVEAVGSGAGESTESQAAAQAAADANANADLTTKMAAAKAGYPNATAGTCPVATTVTPLPATVALPAKRPAKVVLPATVPAGVVSVPTAATLPGAVPAGDGSQAPGLPMWALALIAAGAIGAAAAGKQVLAARK